MLELPPQCTFWRFLASLHWGVARQLLLVQQRMRERVWEAANVRLTSITLDTDTTVHTLYGRQMGGRKSYNPKNKGKKSYQPILTFLAETREYIWGELRNGDRPTGQPIARHLESVFAALPPCIVKIFARADAGFYCWEAVQAYLSTVLSRDPYRMPSFLHHPRVIDHPNYDRSLPLHGGQRVLPHRFQGVFVTPGSTGDDMV